MSQLALAFSASTEWRDIPGYQGRYQASSDGRIKSLGRTYVNRRGMRHRVNERVMSAATGGGRYLNVVVRTADYRPVSSKVHHLVCLTFHGPKPFPEAQVRHLDGDSLNNHASNLCWGTPSENQRDKQRHGRDHNLNKTRCAQGHEYSPENTTIYISPAGATCRRCITCRRRWGREGLARKAMAVSA